MDLSSYPMRGRYRLLVKAKPGAFKRLFVWQIMRNEAHQSLVVATSTEDFQSMAAAHEAGMAVFKKIPID